jgi:LytS/YehU family sensor histidine kinase
MKENMLVMKLMNGKVDNPENKQQHSGIGINNVMKRLGLLYQKRFELQITDEAGIFIVDLKVVLARKQKNELDTPQITTEPSYA